MLRLQKATMLINRDLLTGLSEEACKRQGLPYNELPDIEIAIEGAVDPGPRNPDPDEGPEVDNLKATYAEDVKNEGGRVLFQKGEEVRLTSSEWSDAEDALIKVASR